MSEDQRTSGEIVRLLRKRSGRSLADVAAAVGTSVPFLSDVERGRRIMTAGRAAQVGRELGTYHQALHLVCKVIDESDGRVSFDVSEKTAGEREAVAMVVFAVTEPLKRNESDEVKP